MIVTIIFSISLGSGILFVYVLVRLGTDRTFDGGIYTIISNSGIAGINYTTIWEGRTARHMVRQNHVLVLSFVGCILRNKP